jgi:hypothetical protein
MGMVFYGFPSRPTCGDSRKHPIHRGGTNSPKVARQHGPKTAAWHRSFTLTAWRHLTHVQKRCQATMDF